MKIEKLSLKGFKNLTGDNAWFTLDFRNDYNSTVLIGNNGSGKSNVIEAISSIFSALYKKRLNSLSFQFDLYYSIGDNKYRISKKQKVRYRRCLNGNTTYSYISQEVFYSESNHPYAVQSESLPSQIIALYSGEESRLWEKYYKEFYIKYNSDVISNRIRIENDPKLLYINKYYWDIALLTMIASDVDLNHIIGDIRINEITVKINLENLEKFKKGLFNEVVSFIDNFYFDRGANRLPENEIIIISGDELMFRLDSETHKRLFNLLCVAKLPKNPADKLILDLNIEFDNGLTTSDFSEGEKKKILLQLVLTVLANENTLVLLDEPDTHIHVAHKKQIKEMIETSNVETILTTHSPSLMSAYENQLVFLDKGKIEGKEKADILKEISGDLMSYSEQQIVLNSNNDILLVEGKHDITFIKTAIVKLDEEKYNILRNLEYVPTGGASGLRLFIDKFTAKDNQNIIAILDYDKAGKDEIKEILNEQYKIILQRNNFVKINEFKNTYLFMLPKLQRINNQQFEIEDFFPLEKLINISKKQIDTFKVLKDFMLKKDFVKKQLSIECSDDSFVKSDFNDFKNILDSILLIKAENDGY